MNLNDLLPAVNDNIDLVVIITLLAVGYIVKHTPACDKVSNQYIPIILLVLGVAVTFGTSPKAGVGTNIVGGILNAAIAIAIHSSGKSIFELFSKSVTDTIAQDPEDDVGDDDDLI